MTIQQNVLPVLYRTLPLSSLGQLSMSSKLLRDKIEAVLQKTIRGVSFELRAFAELHGVKTDACTLSQLCKMVVVLQTKLRSNQRDWMQRTLQDVVFLLDTLYQEERRFRYRHFLRHQPENLSLPEKMVDVYVSQMTPKMIFQTMRDFDQDKKNDFLLRLTQGNLWELIPSAIDAGANPNGINRWSEYPLSMAVRKQHIEALKTLLERGADVNEWSYLLVNSILHDAVSSGSLSFVNVLLDRQIKPDIPDRNGWTPICHACYCAGVSPERLAIVDRLLKSEVNVNVEIVGIDGKRLPLLHIIAGMNNEVVVKLLIKAGAVINWKQTNSLDLLTKLIEENRVKVVKLLTRSSVPSDPIIGMQINSFGSLEMKDLLFSRAIVHGDLELVKSLLDVEQDFDLIDNRGLSLSDERISWALKKSVSLGYKDVVSQLVECGAELNPVTDPTPLAVAVEAQETEIVKCLLELGADPNRYSPLVQGSLLHAAITTRVLNIFESLIDHGADCEVLDSQGNAPIHIAVRKGDLDFLKKLLDKRVNLQVLDAQGRTPYQLAKLCGDYIPRVPDSPGFNVDDLVEDVLEVNLEEFKEKAKISFYQQVIDLLESVQ